MRFFRMMPVWLHVDDRDEHDAAQHGERDDDSEDSSHYIPIHPVLLASEETVFRSGGCVNCTDEDAVLS
jgi:hypothetical protein